MSSGRYWDLHECRWVDWPPRRAYADAAAAVPEPRESTDTPTRQPRPASHALDDKEATHVRAGHPGTGY